MDTESTGNDQESRAEISGTGYPAFQMAKAFTTASEHADADTRARAEAKIQQWQAVFKGIWEGSLHVGSRTPVKGTPAWATLEVVTGGFATGALLAEGPLQAHEKALLEELNAPETVNARAFLNSWFLTEPGLEHLMNLLNSGRFEINVPEEGALLTVAWLLLHDQPESARNLLDELSPWFSRLRFYPVPLDQPPATGSRVYLQPVSETLKKLKELPFNRQLLAQNETIQVWLPMYDRLAALWNETVKGALPDLKRDADGTWKRAPGGPFPVIGDWPWQVFPEDWKKRAQTFIDEFTTKRKVHTWARYPDRQDRNFRIMLEYLKMELNPQIQLFYDEQNHLRKTLATYNAKYGSPDGSVLQEKREWQEQQANGPTYKDISRVLIERLEKLPQDNGLDDPEFVLGPVSPREAVATYLPEGLTIPEALEKRVERSLRESIEVLIEKGLITSGETLARLLPQITSEIRAAGITEPVLRRLYAAIYQAFRRRRSLLLLNLESQVKLEELPWVQPIDGYRSGSLAVQEIARQTLSEVMVLTVSAFPQTILPNKLLQELRALLKDADYSVPMVDEIAADIFMGDFGIKFVKAAAITAEMLRDTVYTRYYGIDTEEVLALAQPENLKTERYGKKISPGFMQLCERRAGVKYGGWSTVINGKILEQQQILTTQNLAPLFQQLNLVNALGDQLVMLPQKVFTWICKRLQMNAPSRHAELIKIKKCAYAWRQMLFYLSLVSEAELHAFLDWGAAHLAKQQPDFREKFAPGWAGLLQAAGRSEKVTEQPLQFLGWVEGVHWLM